MQSTIDQFFAGVVPTIAQVDAVISDVLAEVEALAAEKETLTQDIANNWRGDTSAQQQQIVALQARIDASETVIERLNDERNAALIRQYSTELGELAKAQITATAVYKALVQDANAIRDRLKDAETAVKGAEYRMYAPQGRITELKGILDRMGVYREAIDKVIHDAVKSIESEAADNTPNEAAETTQDAA